MPEPLYCGPLTIELGGESRDLGWCSVSRALPWLPLEETPAVVVRVRTERGRGLSLTVSRRAIVQRRVERPTLDGAPFVYWTTRLPLPCLAGWRGEVVTLSAAPAVAPPGE